MSDIACLLFFYGKRYEQIGRIAVESFKAFHPDIDLIHVNESNSKNFKATQYLNEIGYGAYKYMLAYEVMKTKKYSKIIILGADTITCARLDEFINDNTSDVIGTLDYPYALVDSRIIACRDPQKHLNADVVCFNSSEALLDAIKESRKFKNYAEQGGLNYVCHSGLYKYTLSIADGPYSSSKCVYNVRSKGNICLPFEYQDHSANGGPAPLYPPWERPWGKYLKQFCVKDDQLYDSCGKQVKVWHYCEGFGTMSDDIFEKIINNYINNWFNQETKDFFRDHCNAGSFFHEEYKLL